MHVNIYMNASMHTLEYTDTIILSSLVHMHDVTCSHSVTNIWQMIYIPHYQNLEKPKKYTEPLQILV